MNRYLPSFLIALLLLFSRALLAQEQTERTALELIRSGNYKAALPYFAQLAEKDPNSVAYSFNLGLCYIHLGPSKYSMAVEYLEKAARSKKADPVYHYWLGKAYLLSEEPEKAIATLNRYIDLLKAENKKTDHAEKLIQNCRNFIELQKQRVDVSFENAGAAINSPYKDYTPFVSDNESFMIFNSRRGNSPESKILKNGELMSDVFISTDVEGKWTVAKSIGNNINQPERDEEVVGVAADGKSLVFIFRHDSSATDLYVGPKEGDRFFEPQLLSKPVLAPTRETAATLAPDGNTIYFVSDREGSLGGLDIFRVIKVPTGEWSEPMNMGPAINTSEDEDFPFITADGKRLFFSSKGHNSMGGYDIFSSTFIDSGESWGGAKNMGYPLNTPEDNLSFSMSFTGRYGYVSANRYDSYGDLDIYRVIFHDIEPEKTLIKGFVASTEGMTVSGKVRIDVKKQGRLVGTYVPNQYTGKYIMILEPGDYSVEVFADGYKTLNTSLKILDKSAFQPERINDIYILEK